MQLMSTPSAEHDSALQSMLVDLDQYLPAVLLFKYHRAARNISNESPARNLAFTLVQQRYSSCGRVFIMV